MAKPRTIRWGIMGEHVRLECLFVGNRKLTWYSTATGGIARTFTKDLLVDPTTRGVHDIHHTVTAVASSSSADSAKKFVDEVVASKQSSPSCAAYGSYEELVKDGNVDIIYVASPHSHHYQNCMLCLEHGKPVLCEKALTVNADQAKILYKTAKEKNLFFMEAVSVPRAIMTPHVFG